jgi:hypothetical protein
MTKKKDTFFEPEVDSMHTKNGKMYVCSCGSEALAVDQWEDADEHDCVTMSMWMAGAGGKVDWKWQLRAIWYIIKHGHPYADEICLSKSQTVKLGKLLLKLAKKAKPRKED